MPQAAGRAGPFRAAPVADVDSVSLACLGLPDGLESEEAATAVAVPSAAGLAADAAVAALPLTEGAGLVAREGKLSSSRLGGACMQMVNHYSQLMTHCEDVSCLSSITLLLMPADKTMTGTAEGYSKH